MHCYKTGIDERRMTPKERHRLLQFLMSLYKFMPNAPAQTQIITFTAPFPMCCVAMTSIYSLVTTWELFPKSICCDVAQQPDAILSNN